MTLSKSEILLLSSWMIGAVFLSACNKAQQTHSQNSTNSPISNIWGKAITKKVAVKEFSVFIGKEGFAYNHHPQITSYKGKLLATWSSGIYNEDEPGQIMLLSSSTDEGETWSNPSPIFDKQQGKYNDLVYTSEGILLRNDTLFAFCGVYDYESTLEVKQDPVFPKMPEEGLLPYQKIATSAHRTELKISVDNGKTWSASKTIIKDFIPNLKPFETISGRLIIPGNMSFPYTDHSPISRKWKMSGVDGLPPNFIDAPRWFEIVQEEVKFSFQFCEASIIQLDNGTLKAFFRTNQKYLAVSESKNNGKSWTSPKLTDFTDCGSRFEFGILPDGRYFGITCPKPKSVRTPLILATSEDGRLFNKHFILGDEPATEARISGRWKYGRYGYPSFHFKDGKMYVIYSNNKEDIQLFRFSIAELN
ncbi:MAG: sialidase family protein [Bacteroidota bacterium]